MAATAIAVTAGVLLGLNLAEWLWITLAIGLVWLAECFNTAVERLCDLVTTQRDERVAVIKDLAAGGVLIATIVAIVIGVLVLVPQLGGQR